MSDKNKIAIVFEAVADKALTSLKNILTSLSNVSKEAKNTTKITKDLDNEFIKLAKETSIIGNSSKDYGKTLEELQGISKDTVSSTIEIIESNKENEKTISDLQKAILSQQESYKELIKETLNVGKSIDDIQTINEEYIDTLQNLEKEYSKVIDSNEDFKDINIDLQKEIKQTQNVFKELKDLQKTGTATMEDANIILKKYMDTGVELNKKTEKSIGVFDKFSLVLKDFGEKGIGGALKKLGDFVPAVMALNIGFNVAAKGIGLLGKGLQGAFDNSKNLQDSISNLKTSGASAFAPMLDILKSIGDIIALKIIDPLSSFLSFEADLRGNNLKEVEKLIDKEKERKDVIEETYKKQLEHNKSTAANNNSLNEANDEALREYNRSLYELYNSTYKELENKSEKQKQNIADYQKQIIDLNNEIENYSYVGDDFGAGLELKKKKIEDLKISIDNAKAAELKANEEIELSLTKIAEVNKNAVKANEVSLASKLKEIDIQIAAEIKITSLKVLNAKEQATELENIEKQRYERKLSLLKEETENQIKAGKDISSVYIEGVGNLETTIKDINGKIAGYNNTTFDGLLQKLQDTHAVETELIKTSFQNQKDINIKLKESDKSMYEEKLKLLEEAAREQIANGNDISKVNVENMGTLKDAIKQTREELDKLNGKTKTFAEQFKSEIGEVMNSLGSIASSAMKLIQGSWKASIESLTEYETAIDTAKQKQIDDLDTFDKIWKDSQDAKKEEKEAADEEENNAFIERLESEMQRSLEASDILSAQAIQNKINELNAEKKKKADEKEMKEKEKTEEDKMKKDRVALETELNNNIAMAEYKKAMAEYNNNVALAEMEKNKAIADAGLSVAQGLMNAALMPLQPGFSVMGPAGVFSGIGMAATAMLGVMGAIGGIQSASANLDSVKATTPTPPKFAYGTSGYSLKNGESAIVGEQGAEMVRQKAGGELEVISTNQTKNKGVGSGEINVNINVYGMMFSEAIEEIKNTVHDTFLNMKIRDLNYAV